MILLTVTTIFLGQRQLSFIRNHATAQMTVAMQLIAEYVSVPLVFNEPEEAYEVLSKLETMGFISSAAVYTAEGELFTYFGGDSGLYMNSYGSFIKSIAEEGEILHLETPIIYKDVRYGTLHSIVDEANQRPVIRESLIIFILFFLAMAILSIILTFIFERKFLQPILLIAQNFKKISPQTSFIASPDPILFNKKQSNELEYLVDGYNQMLNNLGYREQKQIEAENALKVINDNLEFEITNRTSELKQAHEKVSRLFENERNIVKNLPYGIILMDYNLNIVEMNDFAKQRLGYVNSSAKTVSDICQSALCLEDIEACPFIKSGDITLNERSRQSSFTDIHGNAVPVLKTVIPIEYNEKKVIMEAFVDISDLKDTQLELIKAKEKAEESDRLKSSFLANMSHEIRTPLNAIVGFTGILISEDLDDELKDEYRRIVEFNTDNLLCLIEDILDLSKLESKTLSMKPQEIDLLIFLNDISENGEMLITRDENKELKFAFEIDPLLTSQVVPVFDSSRIKQVILNLLSNAIKFTDRGTITFGLICNEEEFLFYVKDEGIGISDEEKERIFDRFYKSNRSMEKLYGGTGLGLAICKNIIELIGGELWVESELGKGTTFNFTIPKHIHELAE